MDDLARELAVGSVAGAAGVLVGHPLDTLKARVQTGAAVRGAWFAGLAPPLVGVGCYQALAFAGLHLGLRGRAREECSLGEIYVAGAGAGVLTTLATAPADFVKIHQQLRPGASAAALLREAGLRGAFRGSVATMARDVPSTGVYFGAYEYGLRHLGMGPLAAGGMAGLLAWGMVVPLDAVKTNVQGGLADSWLQAFRDLRAAGGLFRGAGPLLLRSVPVNAATFWVYEVGVGVWDG